ncbi:MAG: hypothetical protein HUK22_07505, partial [Thermoguttaceae bacterium]|nr:hypothetical protein [Thermoguttaceae bacterium]
MSDKNERPAIGAAFKYNAIYVYAREGVFDALKIGMTSFDGSTPFNELSDDCEVLRAAAEKRIKEQTQTAGVVAQLQHV